jgi:hypothetical protein
MVFEVHEGELPSPLDGSEQEMRLETASYQHHFGQIGELAQTRRSSWHPERRHQEDFFVPQRKISSRAASL